MITKNAVKKYVPGGVIPAHILYIKNYCPVIASAILFAVSNLVLSEMCEYIAVVAMSACPMVLDTVCIGIPSVSVPILTNECL